MTDTSGVNRSRAAWLAVGAVLGAVVLAFLVAFIGTFVLGLFFYYAVRPLHRRLHALVGYRGTAASLTLLVVVVPGVALTTYAGLQAFQELVAFVGPEVTSAIVDRLPADPRTLFTGTEDPAEFARQLEDIEQFRAYLETGLGAFGTLATGFLHLTLASVFAAFLLRDGYRLEQWFREGIADEDSAAYTYLRTVDAELQVVYLGNVATVLLVTVLALALYNGYNLLAPPAVVLPAPTLLALLTGLATFIPLVVGKLVYLPAAGYLLVQATAASEPVLWAPVAFLVVSFLLLDLVPQTFVRPYISGRTLHTGLVLFSYILGAAFFGWYGLFLGPLLAVLVVHFAKLVLPEVVRGDPIEPENRSPIAIGIDPLLGEADRTVPPAGEGGETAEGSGETGDDGDTGST